MSKELFVKNCLTKVNDELGLVMGWAIISKINGEDYYDTQYDNIPEDAMLEAANDFMQKSRVMKLMHEGDSQGTVVFAWPLTEEIAKSFGIECNKSGLMIAVKPDSDEILEKFRKGELTGFSIGGYRIEDEEIDD